jgi:FkbH-like protein
MKDMVEHVVPSGKPIKLVVWDVENDLWGRPILRRLVRTLDERGILQSLVSRDDAGHLLPQLCNQGIAHFFLHSRLGVQATADKVREIADDLGIRLDGVLMISGSRFERSRVTRAHPQVRGLGLNALANLADDPLMGQSLAGLESRPRRLVYLEEQLRKRSERDFRGSRAEFLAALAMRVSIAPAPPAQLHRVAELANRPNQLGTTYSDQELLELLCSPAHACWLVSLQDVFGDCGKVGLILMELAAGCWTLRLLLFSCRVTPRCVDTLVLNWLLRRARAAHVTVRALFKPTSRNESLRLMYQRAGFEEMDRQGEVLELTHRLEEIAPDPCPAQLVFNGV